MVIFYSYVKLPEGNMWWSADGVMYQLQLIWLFSALDSEGFIKLDNRSPLPHQN